MGREGHTNFMGVIGLPRVITSSCAIHTVTNKTPD